MDRLTELGMHAGALPKIFENAQMLRASLTRQESCLWDYLNIKSFWT